MTPLQMAMVAGAIGIGGKLMEPQAVDRIVAPGGRVVAPAATDAHTPGGEPATPQTRSRR